MITIKIKVVKKSKAHSVAFRWKTLLNLYGIMVEIIPTISSKKTLAAYVVTYEFPLPYKKENEQIEMACDMVLDGLIKLSNLT